MKNRIVLMVDDDPDDRDLFREAIKEIGTGIQCYNSVNGLEALKVLNETNLKPDVIFLDINMPEMNGWECLMHLKSDSRLRNVPVIMYSTSRHQADVEKALDLGAACLFVKPDTFGNIKDVLTSIVQNIDGDFKTAIRKFHDVKMS